MPLSTPREFFELVVLPNYEAFLEDPSDVRAAMNAVLSAAHLRDWMLAAQRGEFTGFAAGMKGYQSYLEAKNPSFRTLVDVANAMKHFERHSTSRLGASGIGHDAFRAGDPVGTSLRPIRVRRDDGRHVLVDELLADAIAMWHRELDDREG